MVILVQMLFNISAFQGVWEGSGEGWNENLFNDSILTYTLGNPLCILAWHIDSYCKKKIFFEGFLQASKISSHSWIGVCVVPHADKRKHGPLNTYLSKFSFGNGSHRKDCTVVSG